MKPQGRQEQKRSSGADETPGTVTADMSPAEATRPELSKPGYKLCTLRAGVILYGMHQDAGKTVWVPLDRVEKLKRQGVI
jgi:hypothetical protein